MHEPLTKPRMNQLDLKGRNGIVTGGARGIGFAYAKRFMAEGAKIVIGDVLDKEGEAAVAELGKGNAIYRHCDVTKKADQEALMDAAVSTFGGLDVLIANAGIVTHGGFLDVTEEEADKILLTLDPLAGMAGADAGPASSRFSVSVPVPATCRPSGAFWPSRIAFSSATRSAVATSAFARSTG